MCPTLEPPQLTVAPLNDSWILTGVLYFIIAGACAFRYIRGVQNARRDSQNAPTPFRYVLVAFLFIFGLFLWGQLAYPWLFAINTWQNREQRLMSYQCVLTTLDPVYTHLRMMENVLFAAGVLTFVAGIIFIVFSSLQKRW